MSNSRTGGANYFRFWAKFARDGQSPLYERLTLAIAEDPQILAFAAKAREGQPQANILFAAVHALLLDGADDPLKDYYPSCGGKRSADDGDVYSAFKDFVARYEGELVPIIAARVTNTNEVGRSALIYPALDRVAREEGGPLQIIEVGPSAGLNLNWHRFGYRYTDEEGTPVLERGEKTGLILTSILKGPGRPRLAPLIPIVERALGLERNPVDLTDPAERLWLRALIWPERLDRLARLDQALTIAAAYPPRIEQANAAWDLLHFLRDFESDAPICVVHTLVSYQFDRVTREAFEAALTTAAHKRAIFEITVEWDGSGYPIELIRHDRSGRLATKLARCDPHGTWLEWLAD